MTHILAKDYPVQRFTACELSQMPHFDRGVAWNDYPNGYSRSVDREGRLIAFYKDGGRVFILRPVVSVAAHYWEMDWFDRAA